MTTLNLVSLLAMLLLFLLWTVLVFRMLWRLTHASLDRLGHTGGGYLTWSRHSIRAFFRFFVSREDRAERWILLLVTGLLFASILVRPLLLH